MSNIGVRLIIVWSGFGVCIVVFGMLSGALVLDLIDNWLLREHFIKGPEGSSSNLKQI